MPIYVKLVKSTAEGIKSMPDCEGVHKEIHKMAEQMGIKGIGAQEGAEL